MRDPLAMYRTILCTLMQRLAHIGQELPHSLNFMHECEDYLRSLPLLGNFQAMAKELFRPLSEELVAEALNRLNSISFFVGQPLPLPRS